MAALTLGYRQSAAESFDDNRSRYIPSSVYSGPGPEVEVEDLPPMQPVQHHMQPTYPPASVRNGSSNSYAETGGFQFDFNARPPNSDALNISDPVAMHLLTETALGDSKHFDLLSFEELEQAKREKTVLRTRVQQTKKKLALEKKLRDAAQSLNRLYNKGHHRTATSGSKGSVGDVSNHAVDEYTASNRRIEELSQELDTFKERLDDVQRRILEHTAGVLQLTHRGLKRNLRKHEMPRSPESMVSGGHRSISGGPLLDEFDERSLYPVPDYVNDFVGIPPLTPALPPKSAAREDLRSLTDMAARLDELSSRLHRLALRSDMTEMALEPPVPASMGSGTKVDAHIDASLTFLSTTLDSLSASQQRTLEKSESVNARIHDMLERTNSMSRSPLIVEDEPHGEDLASQLAFSTRVLEQLQSRIETLVEQKDILTRQIQQQRELNTKSDAQRDAQIHDLTEELGEAHRKLVLGERDAQQTHNQISQLMDQLDRAREDHQLLEQQQGMGESKALEAERDARKRAEKELTDQIEAKQQINAQIQADLAKTQNDMELRSQQHIHQMNELSQAKEQAELEANSHRAETEKMLQQIAGIQTELVMAKAELDGAYGSRAQRAADVSSNPAVQKQIDDLHHQNSQLQKELQDTIGDYEQMTKESIEFEKERDNLEASIDSLRDKCDSLELQLNEEKLRGVGSKSAGPTDTTSTMVLKNEFKKMMRDTRADNMKALRHEQEERRRLEGVIRQMKKEMGSTTPAKSITSPSLLSAGPGTPA